MDAGPCVGGVGPRAWGAGPAGSGMHERGGVWRVGGRLMGGDRGAGPAGQFSIVVHVGETEAFDECARGSTGAGSCLIGASVSRGVMQCLDGAEVSRELGGLLHDGAGPAWWVQGEWRVSCWRSGREFVPSGWVGAGPACVWVEQDSRDGCSGMCVGSDSRSGCSCSWYWGRVSCVG
jgi:hypothetical protein